MAKRYVFHKAQILADLPRSTELGAALAEASTFLRVRSKSERKLQKKLLEAAEKTDVCVSLFHEYSFLSHRGVSFQLIEAKCLILLSEGELEGATRQLESVGALGEELENISAMQAIVLASRIEAAAFEHNKAAAGYSVLQEQRGFFDERQIVLDCLTAQALSSAWLGDESGTYDLLVDVENIIGDTEVYFQEDRLLYARYVAVGCWLTLVQSSSQYSQSAGFGSEFQDPASFRSIESILADSKICLNLLRSISVPAYVGEISTLDLFMDVLFHLWIRVRAAENLKEQTANANVQNEEKSRPPARTIFSLFGDFVSLQQDLSQHLPLLTRRVHFHKGLFCLMKGELGESDKEWSSGALSLNGSSTEHKYFEGEMKAARRVLLPYTEEGTPTESSSGRSKSVKGTPTESSSGRKRSIKDNRVFSSRVDEIQSFCFSSFAQYAAKRSSCVFKPSQAKDEARPPELRARKSRLTDLAMEEASNGGSFRANVSQFLVKGERSLRLTGVMNMSLEAPRMASQIIQPTSYFLKRDQKDR